MLSAYPNMLRNWCNFFSLARPGSFIRVVIIYTAQFNHIRPSDIQHYCIRLSIVKDRSQFEIEISWIRRQILLNYLELSVQLFRHRPRSFWVGRRGFQPAMTFRRWARSAARVRSGLRLATSEKNLFELFKCDIGTSFAGQKVRRCTIASGCGSDARHCAKFICACFGLRRDLPYQPPFGQSLRTTPARESCQSMVIWSDTSLTKLLRPCFPVARHRIPP